MNPNTEKSRKLEAELLKLTKLLAENSAQITALSSEIQHLQNILNELNKTGQRISSMIDKKTHELAELYRENIRLF
ncbi:MAG TPA: hypothetical protein VK892_18895 [Pyrinomonadaceae bacterium]|nr:hypothetical protein [Pyrinomonadaceae bacterium]